MSGPSSILETLRGIPTAETFQEEHQITLVDEERRQDEGEDETQDAERRNSEAPAASATPGTSPLTQKLTRNPSELRESLRREWTRRKYAKYDRRSYGVDSVAEAPPHEDSANQPQQGEEASAEQVSYLERGLAKTKSLLKRKRTLGQGEDKQDTVIDILYENQRGMFLFGIPKYSSSSLLPSDPRPWQNAQFRTSPVDIRNAQVPDPSWEWVWKTWYVDMSRDVDEEGWEYSFKFLGGFAWHGNHPWFHSFVRRRRWLRMRRRRDTHRHLTMEKGHELTAEYFTIHPRTLRPMSEDLSKANSSELLRMQSQVDEEIDIEKMEIGDIGSLIRVLRKAAIDREKLVAVRKFVDHGGDELYYLSERMPEIMSLFIFQSSRRQLLAALLSRYDEASKRSENLQDHQHGEEDEEGQKEHAIATTQADNLMKAVRAADEQVKKLEYWSDIKDMAERGEILQESEGGKWDIDKWQGLSPVEDGHEHPESAFASKQEASEGMHDLHKHAEHTPSKKSSIGVWFDTSTKEGSEATGYYTPAESASELSTRKKGKGRASNSALDGVDESFEDQDQDEKENDDPERGGSSQAAVPDIRSPRKQSVQIVEPIPETPLEKDNGEGS